MTRVICNYNPGRFKYFRINCLFIELANVRDFLHYG